MEQEGKKEERKERRKGERTYGKGREGKVREGVGWEGRMEEREGGTEGMRELKRYQSVKLPAF